MDPLSITVACVSLTASIAKTSLAVTTFVRAVRSARSDLDGVGRELASLTTLLELIAEDAKDIDSFPKPLRKHISGIITNCELVLVEVQRLIEKYDQPGFIKSSKWALTGSEDVAKLQLSLEAHKSALEIALEMVTLSITKEIKNNTTHLRDDTAAIKSDTAEILHEIARLRAQLPDDQATLQPKTEASESTLARYLDDLTSYAETVCWSGEDSDTDVEDDGSIIVKKSKSKSLSPTISVQAPDKTPSLPVRTDSIQMMKDQFAGVMPPPGYIFEQQDKSGMTRSKSVSNVEDLSLGALPPQIADLSLTRSPPRPLNLPLEKSRAIPLNERRLIAQKAAQTSRILASASATDLHVLSGQLATVSQSNSGAPNISINSQPLPRGVQKRLDALGKKGVPPSPARSPIYSEERKVEPFKLNPLSNIPVIVEPENITPTAKDVAQSSEASTILHSPIMREPAPEIWVQKGGEISIAGALSALNTQAETLRKYADYVQAILDDDPGKLSKAKEMTVRDFAYKVHTLRTEIHQKNNQVWNKLPFPDPTGIGSSMLVRDDIGYFEQKVSDIIAEGFKMERDIGRAIVVRADNRGGEGGGTSTLAQHRESNNAKSNNQSPDDTPHVLYQARASHTFETAFKNELTFRKGQLINVTKNLLNGWGIGYVDGIEPKQIGNFPLKYVEYFSSGPILPAVRVPDLVQEQPWTIVSNPSPVTSNLNRYDTNGKSQSDHYASPFDPRTGALLDSTTRQQPPDSTTTDGNLRPGQQPKSLGADIVSNRDCRNTLATVPEEWDSYGYLEHAVDYSVTTQRHKKNSEFVVVKSYRRGSHGKKSQNLKVMREAEILGLFSHPHIVHLRYFTRTSTTWLLYFEHAGFTTLSQYIEQHGKFSRPAPLNTQSWGAWDVSNEHTTRRFARQIGSALRYCHFHCVHHLNLHSDKIVINNKGNIKLTGFGSLQLVSANDDENFDTFSYGTILWHMACGTVPWPVHENFDRYLRNLSSVVSNSGIFTSECFDLISGLLSGDTGPIRFNRFGLKRALSHPWMLVNFDTPVPDHMFNRKPLDAINESTIRKLRLFNFAEPAQLQKQLTSIIHSPAYMDAKIAWDEERAAVVTPVESLAPRFGLRQSIKKGFGESWAKSRAKRSSQLEPIPSEPVPVEPVVEFYELVHSRIASPELAMYNLAKEKMDREQSRLSFETMAPIIT